MSTPRKLAVLTLVLLVLGAVAEVCALRLTDAASFTRFGQRLETGMDTGLEDFNRCLRPDPELFWVLAPDQRLPDDPSRPFFGLVSNSFGWRGPEPRARRAGEPLVLCLGDSCTFGFGASMEEAWPQRLGAHLRSGGRAAQVVNAGVPGYASSQGLALARRLVPGLQPDVVIVAFGWNDGSRWDGRTDLQHRAEVVAAPTLLERSRAYLVLRGALRDVLRGRGDRAGETPRVPLPEYQANLGKIHELCLEWGARPVFVAWPFRAQIEDPDAAHTAYQRASLQAGGAPGGLAVDLVAALRGRFGPELYLDRGHVGPAGYDAIAATLAERLLAAGL